MANSETDVETLQVSLAGAALRLLACEKKIDPASDSSEGPYEIARLLGYEGDFEPTDRVRKWLKAFLIGQVAARVTERKRKR